MRHVTLRLRLTLTLVALVFAGLVVASGLTYYLLRSFLLQRVDQQLTAATYYVPTVLANKGATLPDLGNPQKGDTLLPPGTYGAVLDATGAVAGGNEVSFTYGVVKATRPALPGDIVSEASQSGGVVFTAAGSGAGAPRYRVSATRLAGTDYTLVVAIPLTDMAQTLARLVLVEALVAIGVLAALGALAWYLVRRELRPLEDMATTAGAIAGGDLGARVEHTEPGTEVGRLGIALNAMLAQIERSFERRMQSEEKLRRFLAQASHELRTPLVSIRGYAELFRRGAKDRPEDLELAMRRIEQEAARMGVLVDELLQVARRDEERPLEQAPVDLSQIADDAVTDAHAVAPERSIELVAPAPVVVSGDEGGLRQLVANLVVNALQHAGDGASVTVNVERDGDRAVLEVADDGVGMDADDAKHVFEPFYRTEQSRVAGQGSTGLGLSIVAAIAERHRGTVDVATAPGEGSRFTVTLPLSSAES